MAKKKKGPVPPQLQKGKSAKPGSKPPAGGPPGSQNMPPGMKPPGNGGPPFAKPGAAPVAAPAAKKKGKGKVPPQFQKKSK